MRWPAIITIHILLDGTRRIRRIVSFLDFVLTATSLEYRFLVRSVPKELCLLVRSIICEHHILIHRLPLSILMLRVLLIVRIELLAMRLLVLRVFQTLLGIAFLNQITTATRLIRLRVFQRMQISIRCLLLPLIKQINYYYFTIKMTILIVFTLRIA